MTNDITKPQKCIVMRNGVEVWVDVEKAERFERDWVEGLKGAVRFEGRTLNTADILGVFLPGDMEDLTRRKNRQWKCQHGGWHDLGEKCQCLSDNDRSYLKRREEAIKSCGICKNGWLHSVNGYTPTAKMCDCVAYIKRG